MENRFSKYAQGGVQTKPADPLRPGAVVKQGQDIAQGGYSLERAAAEAPYVAPKAAAEARNAQLGAQIKEATAPAEVSKAGADARRAMVDADVTEITKGAGAEQSKAASFYTRALDSNSVYNGLGVGAPSAGREIAKSVLPEMLINQFTDSDRQQAEAAERNFIAATLRYESGAALPPSEFVTQRKVFFPAPGDSAETIALKTRFRKNAIDGLRVSAGPAALNVPQPSALASPAIPTQIGGNQLSDMDVQQGRLRAPGMEAATGENVTEFDQQMSSDIDALVRMGRPPQEILAYIKSKGFEAGPQQAEQIAENLAYSRSNPGYKGGFAQASKVRPTTMGEQLAGSPASAFFNGIGTAMTAGLNDEAVGGASALLGGDYGQSRDAFNAQKGLVADANPLSDLAGTALGAGLSMYGLGGVGGAAGNALGRGGGMVGDAGYGAAFGAGQDNQHRLRGGVLGGLSAGAGNVAGHGLAAGVGGLVSPTGGAMKPLYDMGVRPSIGQRMGGVANRLEEKLQSLPFVGDAIAGTRQRARDQFQTGLFDDALGDINTALPKGTGPGVDAHAFAQRSFGNAYDTAERGMVAQADGPFASDLGQLQRTVGGLRKESQGQFTKLFEGSVARRFNAGQLSGEAYKDAMSELSKKARSIRKNPTGDSELADAIEEAMGVLRGSASRNSPADAVKALDNVDSGYAKLVRIEDAARRRGGDAGTFSPVQYDSAVQGMSGGVRSRGYLSGNALNQDIATLGKRLGDEVPNSGTMDRLATGGLAAGAGFLEPSTLTALGTLGLLNAPGVRNATTALLSPSKKKGAQTLADYIRLTGKPMGALGAGTGIALSAR